jgi:hydroxypyruvate reductase
MATFEEKKQHIQQILAHAVAAVDPYPAVRRVFSRAGDSLLVNTSRGTRRYMLKAYKYVWVVGCGKAGAPMSLAVEDVVGDLVSGGIVVVRDGYAGDRRPQKITIVEASHPQPDERGMSACRDTIEVLKKANAHHLVLAVISGGGSALWPQPPLPVSLEDKQAATRLLLAGGADIRDVNIVRKHLSLIKGGWAARYANPADVIVMVVSDVIGDDLETIASGPFSPDPTTFSDALQVLAKYKLNKKMPDTVVKYLQDGMNRKTDDTPKPGDADFQKVTHILCATNHMALEAAADKASMLGYEPLVFAPPLCGECREAANEFCKRITDLQPVVKGKPRCVISGGETTVTLGKTHGKGGRNQQFALVSAFALQESEHIVVAGFGTDGIDGFTDAAGAVADHTTVARARSAGCNPAAALESCDAYPLFQKLGDLIITGPTGTNVADIQIALVG